MRQRNSRHRAFRTCAGHARRPVLPVSRCWAKVASLSPGGQAAQRGHGGVHDWNPSVRPNAEEGIMYEATRMAQGDDPCRTASWRILVELVSNVP